jgi:hypothetical protein
MVHSAPRLSSVAAYGHRLPLDAAALSAPSTCSCNIVKRYKTQARPTQIAATALGVDGAAASRRRPQAGGQLRSRPHQAPRRAQPTAVNNF